MWNSHKDIYVADAVPRSKLLYGLESAQLLPLVVRSIETFQSTALGKILRMGITYVDRARTNAVAFQTACDKMAEEGKQTKLQLL